MNNIVNLNINEIENISGGNESEYDCNYNSTRDWPIVDAIIIYIGGQIGSFIKKSLRPGEH
jgi:hypothetical protein